MSFCYDNELVNMQNGVFGMHDESIIIDNSHRICASCKFSPLAEGDTKRGKKEFVCLKLLVNLNSIFCVKHGTLN